MQSESMAAVPLAILLIAACDSQTTPTTGTASRGPSTTLRAEVDGVERMCEGEPVEVARTSANEDAGIAWTRTPNGGHFTVPAEVSLSVAQFFTRHGGLLGLGLHDTLHASEPTSLPRGGLRHGMALCHRGIRVSGAGVSLTSHAGRVTGGSIIIYRVDDDAPAEPALEPQQALDVASADLPPADLASGVCSDWHLFFAQAERQPLLAYSCRLTDGHTISFSALDGKLISAKRGKPQ